MNLPFNIGYTGTQRGMTPVQCAALEGRLVEIDQTLRDAIATAGYPPTQIWAHHGDCIGGDAQFDAIARKLGWMRHLHIPDNPSKRAFCDRLSPETMTMAAPLPYLIRNSEIIGRVALMFAGPGEFEEQMRSGTWSTVRYARRQRKPIVTIYPDGAIAEGTDTGL